MQKLLELLFFAPHFGHMISFVFLGIFEVFVFPIPEVLLEVPEPALVPLVELDLEAPELLFPEEL